MLLFTSRRAGSTGGMDKDGKYDEDLWYCDKDTSTGKWSAPKNFGKPVNTKNNNGIVILAAMQEHKLRIEVGYGLEGVIPDVTAKAIIDNDVTPNFKSKDYYRGLDAAINSIMEAAR